jgi:hypothetical protein
MIKVLVQNKFLDYIKRSTLLVKRLMFGLETFDLLVKHSMLGQNILLGY